MKKRLTITGFILVMAFVYSNLINAQDYMITFSGSGQSNIVETVEIKNTTQQTSVTLNGSDTLHLVDFVGISPIVQENAGMKVFPNPASHTSRLEFYNAEAGYVIIEMIEISGRVLISMKINLSRGLHAFDIQGLGTGIYMLKATTETKVHQHRLISYSQSLGKPQINYFGGFDPSPALVQMKNAKNMVVMEYNDGERLVIKGISGDYSHTLSLIPTESQHINIEFIGCVDGDGNHYGVVTIGEQVWMSENLKTRKDAAGNDITRYCYENDTINCELYGGLYSWHTVMNGQSSSSSNPSGVQGICPTDWHAPSDAEWSQLTTYLIDNYVDITISNVGNKLKSCRQVNSPIGGDCNTSEHPRWHPHADFGTNDFGFAALPGGLRYSDGRFFGVGYDGCWWSSTEYSSTQAWRRRMMNSNGNVLQNYTLTKMSSFSVRCIKN